MLSPKYHCHADKAHIAKVIAARRILCVGEGFTVASDRAEPLRAMASPKGRFSIVDWVRRLVTR